MPDDSVITGFHHTAIRARDFDRSLRFYTGALGFRPKVTWGDAPKRAVMLDAGDGNYLEVFERPNEAPPSEDSAILHFALRTTDVDDAVRRVRDAGATITVEPKDVEIPNTHDSAPSPLPVRLAFCKGPDGEIIEFFQNEAT